MPKVPNETDVLVPFEIANLPDEYREYYGTKRYNLFAMIQKHPEMWHYFTLLAKILFREIDDLQVSKELDKHRKSPLRRINFANCIHVEALRISRLSIRR